MIRLQKLRTPTLLAMLSTIVIMQAGMTQAADKALPQRETAVAPEINPPGDIPDDQVFISYASPSGFSIEVPEGWARSDRTDGVSFVDKYGTVDVSVAEAAKAPTVDSVKANEVPRLESEDHAVKVTKVREMSLPAGKVVAVDYLANSASNPVTNRKIRLENRRLYYFANGRQAIVTPFRAGWRPTMSTNGR